MISMEKVVIDSDIIIDYLRTDKGLFPLLSKLQFAGKIEMYLSSVSVFELFSGNSAKKDEEIILKLLANMKIVTFDIELAKFAGELRRDKKPIIQLADFIIGVTSVFIRASLVTRNKDHFRGIKWIKFFKVVS